MLHIAAVSQIRLGTEGRAYYRRKIAAGKTPMEAMRCLKRCLSDVVYRQLVADVQAGEETGSGGHCGAFDGSSATARRAGCRVRVGVLTSDRWENDPDGDQRWRTLKRRRDHGP